MIIWKDRRQNLLGFFINVFVSICCVLGHFQGFMLLNETFRLVVTYTFRGTDQSWQTGPNDPALHFEVVFVKLWQQIGKLVQLVLYTFSLILFNYNKYVISCSYKTMKQSFHLGSLLCVYLYDCLKRLLQNSVWMFHLCVCVDL